MRETRRQELHRPRKRRIAQLDSISNSLGQGIVHEVHVHPVTFLDEATGQSTAQEASNGSCLIFTIAFDSEGYDLSQDVQQCRLWSTTSLNYIGPKFRLD